MSQSKKRLGRSRESVEADQKYAITDADRQLTELAAQNLPRNRHAEAFTTSATRGGSGSTAATAQDSDADESPVSQRKRKSSARRELKKSGEPQPTALWYKVVMLGLVLVGLLWIITYYLFQGTLPIPGLEVWNLVIGLAFMMTGLIMTTRWR